jgi:hypothetical protein
MPQRRTSHPLIIRKPLLSPTDLGRAIPSPHSHLELNLGLLRALPDDDLIGYLLQEVHVSFASNLSMCPPITHKPCMFLASQHVLGGLTLWSEATMVRYPDRYVDERGQAFWHTL